MEITEADGEACNVPHVMFNIDCRKGELSMIFSLLAREISAALPLFIGGPVTSTRHLTSRSCAPSRIP